MGIDKKLEIVYDLESINEQQASQLIAANEQVIKSAESQKKKSKKKTSGLSTDDAKIEKRLAKLKKEIEFDLVNGKGKRSLKQKLFGGQDFSKGGITKNIVKFGLNPGGMIGGLLKTGIPGFGAAVAATRIIVEILKKFDDREKKFTDQLNTKNQLDRSNEEVARIQAGLAQEIFSPSPGIYDPRDVYNSDNVFNNDQQTSETEYEIRNTSGVE